MVFKEIWGFSTSKTNLISQKYAPDFSNFVHAACVRPRESILFVLTETETVTYGVHTEVCLSIPERVGAVTFKPWTIREPTGTCGHRSTAKLTPGRPETSPGDPGTLAQLKTQIWRFFDFDFFSGDFFIFPSRVGSKIRISFIEIFGYISMWRSLALPTDQN